MMFGRHQLIKLSPKKTVEGFVGAFFVTIAFAVIVRPFIRLVPRRKLIECAVGNVLHAVQLHDLPCPGSGDERLFQRSVCAEPRLCLARVPAARLGGLGTLLPRTSLLPLHPFFADLPANERH